MSELTAMATRQKKTDTMITEKIPSFIKDLGLLGFCIYVLWVDNDQNKQDIQTLQEQNIKIEYSLQAISKQLQSMQEVNETQNEVLYQLKNK